MNNRHNYTREEGWQLPANISSTHISNVPRPPRHPIITHESSHPRPNGTATINCNRFTIWTNTTSCCLVRFAFRLCSRRFSSRLLPIRRALFYFRPGLAYSFNRSNILAEIYSPYICACKQFSKQGLP